MRIICCFTLFYDLRRNELRTHPSQRFSPQLGEYLYFNGFKDHAYSILSLQIHGWIQLCYSIEYRKSSLSKRRSLLLLRLLPRWDRGLCNRIKKRSSLLSASFSNESSGHSSSLNYGCWRQNVLESHILHTSVQSFFLPKKIELSSMLCISALSYCVFYLNNCMSTFPARHGLSIPKIMFVWHGPN